jgi:hypothetical protein
MFEKKNYALLQCETFFTHDVRREISEHIISGYYEFQILIAELGIMFSPSVGKKLDLRSTLDVFD